MFSHVFTVSICYPCLLSVCATQAILNSMVIEDSKLTTNQKALYVTWQESEMQSRLMKFKATKQLQQLETIYVITGVNNTPQRRNRINFDGCTTAGNVLSSAPLSNLNTGWILTYQEKKDLYGEMRISIGNTSDSGIVVDRQDDTLEPVAYHQTSAAVWEECIRSETMAKVIIDWAPMDNLPILALESGVPYVGVCFTQTHADKLYERLAQMVLQKMKEEGKFFRPELAKILKPIYGAPKAKPAPKAKQDAKVKPQAKASGKRETEEKEVESEPPAKKPKETNEGEETEKKTETEKTALQEALRKKIEAARSKTA